MGKWWITLLLLFFASTSFAADRCLKYVQEIRRSDYRVHGIEFPYHYSVGVAITESSCRPNITSFDQRRGNLCIEKFPLYQMIL